MQNVNVISEDGENKTALSPSSAASITEPTMKPQDGQSKKFSAASENVSTIKGPYGSMANITPSITTGDDTAAIQPPTAVAVQKQISVEPLEYCDKISKLYAGVGERGSDGCHQLPREKLRADRNPSHILNGCEYPRFCRSSAEKIMMFNAEYSYPLHGLSVL